MLLKWVKQHRANIFYVYVYVQAILYILFCTDLIGCNIQLYIYAHWPHWTVFLLLAIDFVITVYLWPSWPRKKTKTKS